MSKLIGEVVRVHLGKESLPDAFIWKKRLYRVEELLSWWREPAEWWNDKPIRFFIRVLARNSSSGVYELCRLGEQWFLSKILD